MFKIFKNKHKQESDESITNGVRLITAYQPKHTISEQLRTVRTNIEFAGAALDELKVVMFTSPEMSDGKSTVAANVAVTWAQAGKKVLLVDADMRRPTVHLTFNSANTQGLSTILAGNKLPEEVITDSFVDNLAVLTAGPVPPNPSDCWVPSTCTSSLNGPGLTTTSSSSMPHQYSRFPTCRSACQKSTARYSSFGWRRHCAETSSARLKS